MENKTYYVEPMKKKIRKVESSRSLLVNKTSYTESK